MDAIDDFFFSESLMSCSECGPVDLDIATDIHKPDRPDATLMGFWSPQTNTINLATQVNGMPVTLDGLLSTLIHEMVHAYLGNYADLDRCEYWKIHAQNGHGMAFHILC
ncbi:hypothetical protein F5Y15DRAFT_393905 [Xylariaceae sp. FL0016]|nr:hypothetical protein F5Y15DRAFT_393905 [Xylariaceae sp. FL0016]